jgi:hypothetical protein
MNDFKERDYVCYSFSKNKLGKSALEMRQTLKTTFGENVVVKTQL